MLSVGSLIVLGTGKKRINSESDLIEAAVLEGRGWDDQKNRELLKHRQVSQLHLIISFLKEQGDDLEERLGGRGQVDRLGCGKRN